MTLWGACQYVYPGYPWPSAYPYSGWLNDTVWQLMVDQGITHVQFWQWNYNESTERNYPSRRMTTQMWVNTVDRMNDFGLEPEFVLCLDQAKATELVQELGSDCMMYEVCKEPHLSGTGCSVSSASSYCTQWNSIVEACRDINASALYGGPAVGVQTSSQTWMNTWLSSCDGDFASFHCFPAGSTKSAAIANATTMVHSNVTMYLNAIAAAGKSIPLWITESQYTSAVQSGTNPSTNWSWDQSFMDSWTDAFCTEIESHSVYANFIWVFMGYDNNFAMVRTPSQSYYRKPQYYSYQDYISNVTVGNKPFTGNALIEAGPLKTFSGDGMLLLQSYKSFSGDGYIIEPPEVEPAPKPFSGDGMIQAIGEMAFSGDGLLELPTPTGPATGIKTFDGDGLIEVAATYVTSWDIIKRLEKTAATGRLVIDGKVAIIDGEVHRIDFAVEDFQKAKTRLEKTKTPSFTELLKRLEKP